MKSYKNIHKDQEMHALSLHKDSIIIDASLVAYTDYVGEDVFLDDMIKGGITASNATVCMQNSFSEAIRELESYHNWIGRGKKKVILARSTEDIYRAKVEGKHAIIFGPQNSQFLEGNTRFLKIAYDYGVRIIQITYNDRNSAGDGCKERCNAGLSNFGVALVEEMNQMGVLIDLSHCGDQTSIEAIEISKDPVAFTHITARESTPKEVSDWANWNNRHVFYGEFTNYANQRSKPDEIIKACTAKGGVIGVTPYFAKKPGNTTLTDDVLDQIDYVVKLVGADHVGFGSDIDFNSSMDRQAYIKKYPGTVDVTYFTAMDQDWGYGWLEFMPNLTKGLVSRGYSDAEVKGILGEN